MLATRKKAEPNINDDDKTLDEALTKWEKALLSPVVSGELESWAQDCARASQEAGDVLRAYSQQVLRAQFAEISSADQELLPRVQQMTQEDKALLEEYALL